MGGAVEQPEWSFYRGAYEICKRDHQSGFEVKSKEWKSYGGVGSGIEGPVQLTRPDINTNWFREITRLKIEI